jgi:hypothetical protein
MNLRFYLDPSTGQPHIFGHGVDEDEVEEVLEAPVKTATGAKDPESR